MIYNPEYKARWFDKGTSLQLISNWAGAIANVLGGFTAKTAVDKALNLFDQINSQLMNPDLGIYIGIALALAGAAAAISTAVITGAVPYFGIALLAMGLVGTLAGSAANSYFRLANDPPDPNFTEVVAYSNAAPTFDFGLGDEANQAFAGLFSSLIHAAEAANGAIVSLERYQGATEAGDATAADLQRSAFEMFLGNMDDAETRAGLAIANFSDLLASQGFADIASPIDPTLTMYGVLDAAAATYQGRSTAVPEPGSVPLLFFGLLMILLLHNRALRCRSPRARIA